jgi:hypothetical protein
MTSIRSFSEILMQADPLDDAARARFSRIIHDESLRLTRLLDDLLDLSVLENGLVTLHEGDVELGPVLDRAIHAAGALAEGGRIAILRDAEAERVTLHTDADRLAQVFINLISNAQKYCDAERPELRVEVRQALGPCRDRLRRQRSGHPRAAAGADVREIRSTRHRAGRARGGAWALRSAARSWSASAAACATSRARAACASWCACPCGRPRRPEPAHRRMENTGVARGLFTVGVAQRGLRSIPIKVLTVRLPDDLP